MNKIIEIIMKREGLVEADAYEYCEDAIMEVQNLYYSEPEQGVEELEDILSQELGLEPDYLQDLLELAGVV